MTSLSLLVGNIHLQAVDEIILAFEWRTHYENSAVLSSKSTTAELVDLAFTDVIVDSNATRESDRNGVLRNAGHKAPTYGQIAGTALHRPVRWRRLKAI
jgi:hypothetical protein